MLKLTEFKSREALMKESLNEFCKFSYNNASLNKIIKNANVSKGSFYYHFKNKEDLYIHLIEESFRLKWEFIQKYQNENAIEYQTLDIFDKFLYQAKTGLLFAEAQPQYSRLANMLLKEKDNGIYTKVMEKIGIDGADLLKSQVEEALAADELDRSYDIEFVEKLLVNMFMNYDVFFNSKTDTDRNLEDLEQFVRFLRNGLGAKK